MAHSISDQHCEIGWMGNKTTFDIALLLKEIVDELAKKKYITVEFEIDTTDYTAYQLADLLELHTKTSWNSYKKRAKARGEM